jgi:hypothetical protein
LGLELAGEFRKRIELMGLDEQTKKKVIDLLRHVLYYAETWSQEHQKHSALHAA